MVIMMIMMMMTMMVMMTTTTMKFTSKSPYAELYLCTWNFISAAFFTYNWIRLALLLVMQLYEKIYS